MKKIKYDMIFNNYRYSYIGDISANYYDTHQVPIDNTNNILELNKLLFGLYELFSEKEINTYKINDELFYKLVNYFSEFKDIDFYHYRLDYLTLSEFEDYEFNYTIDIENKNIELTNTNIKITLTNYPETILNLYCIDENGDEDYDIEKYNKVKLEFLELEDIFMTDEQIKSNLKDIDIKYDKITSILIKYYNENIDREFILNFYQNLISI